MPDLYSPAASDMMIKLTKSKSSIRNARSIEYSWETRDGFMISVFRTLHLSGSHTTKGCLSMFDCTKTTCRFLFVLSNPTLPFPFKATVF